MTEEIVTLPSNGMIEGIPKEVKLRNMTTSDEKLRLSSSGIRMIPELLNSVVLTEGFNAYNMYLFDLVYLMYAERILTYGSDYKVTLRCNKCNNEFDHTVNLSELDVNYLEEPINTEFVIGPLPVSGDNITCKLLKYNDIIRVSEESDKILDRFPDYVGDPSYILEKEFRVVNINGEKLNAGATRSYIENMHAKDNLYFDRKYEEIKYPNDVGLVLNISAKCPKCGNEIKFVLVQTQEFFYPLEY